MERAPSYDFLRGRQLPSWITLGFCLSCALLPPESHALQDSSHELNKEALYQRISPAIVSISATFPDMHSQGLLPVTTRGTGIIFGDSGTVLTNAHLVKGATEIRASFSTGTVLRAEVLTADSYTDVAALRLLQVRAPLTTAPLGDSDQLHIGQTVHVVGIPTAAGFPLTTGIILNVQPLRASARFIETSVPVQPDNGGGPLVDAQGRIIGIIMSPVARTRGPGNAIAINVVKNILTAWISSTLRKYEHVYSPRHTAQEEDRTMMKSALVPGLCATLLHMGCTNFPFAPMTVPQDRTGSRPASHLAHADQTRQWRVLAGQLRERADWWDQQAESASRDEGPLGSAYAVERKLAIARALREEADEAEHRSQETALQAARTE